jgi:hypothetical protein
MTAVFEAVNGEVSFVVPAVTALLAFSPTCAGAVPDRLASIAAISPGGNRARRSIRILARIGAVACSNPARTSEGIVP